MLTEKEVIVDEREIYSYIEDALRMESPIEVIVDDNPKVFFSRFCDFVPPDMEGRIAYKANSYLDSRDHLFVLPVESGMGNYWIRKSARVILRIFTPQHAVELSVRFEEVVDLSEGNVALRMSFPKIGTIIHGSREFRAQVPSSIEIPVSFVQQGSKEVVHAWLYDVSLRGAGLRLSRAVSKTISIEEPLRLKVYNDGGKCILEVNVFVRHLSKRRTLREVLFISGVEFGIVMTDTETDIELLVAQVQRYHLKEVAERSEKSGVNLID